MQGQGQGRSGQVPPGGDASRGGGYPTYPGQQPLPAAPPSTPVVPGEPGGSFGSAPAPYYDGWDDAPGHTRAFTLGGGFGGGFGGTGPDGYPGYTPEGDTVATYRAGLTAAPPSGPRLPWKELISGIVLRPGRTFWQMRDHSVWCPALLVTFGYGLLAVFGFDAARQDILSSAIATSIPWVLITAVAVLIGSLMTSVVTHVLARQLGGDGAMAPTVGLAMLITSLTDVPRLLFAIFLGGANGFVQLLGWLTWLGCGALLISMVGKSHDLKWYRALAASSIQLLALLVLFKLPTL